MRKNNILKVVLFFVLGLGTFHWPEALFAAVNQCVKPATPTSDLEAYKIDDFSQVVMKIVRLMVSDPTKLRKEEKATVNVDLGRAEIQSLKDFFGEYFSLRDKKKEGEVNLTSTMYMTLGKYTSPFDGKEKSTKVRFRRYFTQKAWDTFRQFLSPISKSKETAKMEIKVQHPKLENVVVKLRVDVLLEDIMTLSQGEDFLRNKEALRKRILELNPRESDRVEAELALEYLEVMYKTEKRKHEGIYAHTEYERDSYSIIVQPSPEAAARGREPIEIQITADTKVRLTRILDQANFDVYGDDQIIYELKIPKDQANLTDEDIQIYPGLKRIREFQKWMQDNRDKSLPNNKGKVSKVRSKKYRNGQKYDLRESAEEFLRKKKWIQGSPGMGAWASGLNSTGAGDGQKKKGVNGVENPESDFEASEIVQPGDPERIGSEQKPAARGIVSRILGFLGGDL